jgi:hypothetical protein
MTMIAPIEAKHSTGVDLLREYRCGGAGAFIGDSGPIAANVILHDLAGLLCVLENATRDAEAAKEAFCSDSGGRTSSLMGVRPDVMEGAFASVRTLVSLAAFLSEPD